MSNILDEFLKPAGPLALVYRVQLESVEGRDAIFFPPTFAGEDSKEKEKKESRYTIDFMADGTKCVIVDTVGSQANRVEPLFKDYPELVPEVIVEAGEQRINLLDVGHRAADASFRFSELGKSLSERFFACKKGHDYRPLAKVAPTSIVFGMWDSRGGEDGKDTNGRLKLPRIINNLIEARGIETRKRSAQYNPPIRYREFGLIKDAESKQVKDEMSGLGLSDVPATQTLGGVHLTAAGEIIHRRSLNTGYIKAIGPAGADGDAVRRYILGLCLVAMTVPRDHNLRQGCLLVPREGEKPQFVRVYGDGRRDPIPLDFEAVLTYAREAARAFGVGENRMVKFLPDAVDKAIADTAKKKAAKKNGD